MGNVGFFSSLWIWCKGVLSRCYFWLLALLLDPTDIYNQFKPELWPRYDVSLDAFFYLLGGLVLWTSILTFHDLRRHQAQHPQPNMPLHKVLRWIASESKWGVALDDRAANAWVDQVGREFAGKLVLGKLECWGTFKQDNIGPAYAPTDVPYNFWAYGGVNWQNVLSADHPVQAIRYMKHTYRRVMLDTDQVRRTWPRRSKWSRLWRHRPIDRALRKARANLIWRQQDEAYSDFMSWPAYGPFQSRFGFEDGNYDAIEDET